MSIRLSLAQLRATLTDWSERLATNASQPTGDGRQPRGVRIKQLEDRILMSASPAGAEVPMDVNVAEPTDDAAGQLAAEEGLGLTVATEDSEQTQQVAETTQREIVFVDPAADDAQQLVDDLLQNQDEQRSFEIFMLDGNRDGVEQITEMLANFSELDAVHIVSHGSDGAVKLGNAWLNADSLDGYVGDIVRWGNALSSDADLLIYGCDLASSADGQTLTESLSELTGADVAASIDDTGHVDLGGDWDLEYTVGAVQAELAFSLDVRQSWFGTLSADPIGGEFLVNTETADVQDASAFGGKSVAADANGNFVVVWTSDNQDSVGSKGVYFQRFNADGTAASVEQIVNTTTVDDQRDAAVAMDADGEFVIVWTSLNQDGDTGGDGNIYGQRFDKDGVKQGIEFLISDSANAIGNQSRAAVAMDSDGDFVATWTSDAGGNEDVYARRFLANGIAEDVPGGPVGVSVFLVNTETSLNQYASSIARDAGGGFVIAYTSDTATNGKEILYQRYNAGGDKLGLETAANETSVGDQFDVSVAMDDAGEFVISWTSFGDGDGTGIQARTYDASGTALTGEFWVNTTTTNNQTDSSVSMDADGDLIVTWTDDGNTIRGLDFSVDGVALGADFLIDVADPTATTNQFGASVSSDASGDFIVAWTADGIATDVYSHRFDSDTFANTSPVVNVPATQTIGQDTPLVFWDSGGNPISIADADAGHNDVQVTLTVTNGTLSLDLPSGRARTTGDGILVNTTIGDKQQTHASADIAGIQSPTAQAVATDALGNYVVVWSSKNQDTDGWGVYMQRYNADGVPLGMETRVNNNVTDHQVFASVAMDTDGDYVVTWSSKDQLGAGEDGDKWGVYARRYNSAGVAQGSEFLVNTAFTTDEQAFSTVAMDDAGNFVVTWSSKGEDTDNWGIFAQRYDDVGAAQGSVIPVNTYIAKEQLFSSVAMDADGDFVISWSSNDNQDGDKWGIYAQRFNALGVPQGGETPINVTTTAEQHYSSVSMDANGNFVVTWSSNNQDGDSWGVYARRYDNLGNALSDEFRVTNTTDAEQRYSSVSMSRNGDFVITWSSDDQDGSGFGVYAREYNAVGVAKAAEFQVNSYGTGNQRFSAVSMGNSGNYVIVWTGEGEGDTEGVYAQRYESISGLTFQDGDGVDDATMTFSGRLDDINTVLSGATFTPTAAFTGTATVQTDVDDLGNSGTGGNQTDSESFDINVMAAYANAAPVNDVPGTQVTGVDVPLVFGDAAGNQISVTDIDAGNGDVKVTLTTINGTLSLDMTSGTATRRGDEFRVNSMVGDKQQTHSGADIAGMQSPTAQAVATDALGNYVVVWSSKNQDTDGWGVYMQRYNAAGVALGSETLVNNTVTDHQAFASVDMDVDGDYVITWSSKDQVGPGEDGDKWGVYARRYNSFGVAQGSEFLVNSYTTDEQAFSTVAMDDAGNFVISWSSKGEDTDNWGIFAQRYNSLGVAQGAAIPVNTYITTEQLFSSVAMDADGDFVVSWSSKDQDTGGWGVYAQRFDSLGVAQGAEIPVNVTVAGDQHYSSVSMDAAGNFVVTWSSNGQDGDSWGVYARRYDNLGAASGNEFRVANTTAGEQRYSNVSMSSNGRFVVTWGSDRQDGSGHGVYAREYDANGVAEGDEFQVNSFADGNQRYSAISLDASGNYVIVWSGKGEGDTEGVYGQRYLNATGLTFHDGDGVDDATMTFTGELDVINAALNGMTFTPTLAFTGAANVQIDVDDLGNSGTGGNLTDSDSVDINVTAGYANRAPDIIVPGPQVTAENTAIVFWNEGGNAFLVNDVDAGNNDVQVTMSVTNGTLSLDLPRHPAAAKGGEFRINTTIGDKQQTHASADIAGIQSPTAQAVATDALGNYVVVWSSKNQDTDGWGVYMQRYNADGVPLGMETRVNNNVTDHQVFASVAMDTDGDYVVTWSSKDQLGAGEDGDKWGVYARRYNSAGVAQGSEFLVNTAFTTDEQAFSTVAMDDAGNFVVTWSSKGEDTDNWGIFAQRYDDVGVAQGSVIPVNTYIAKEQLFSSVAMDADGDFVISWSSNDNQDGDKWGIYAQRFNALGVPQGGETPINVTTTAEQHYSSVSMDANGNFVVTWSSNNQDGDSWGVYARRYDNLGNALSDEFRVSNTTDDKQQYSSVSMSDGGDFVITWSSNTQDGSGFGVYAREYNSHGVAKADEFQVHSFNDGQQQFSAVSLDASGNYVIIWSGEGDGDADGVWGQRYETTTGLTFLVGNGINDTTVVFQAKLSDVNAVLDGMTFTPDFGYNGFATLTIDVDDLGNSGTGGALTDQETVDICVGACNALPTGADNSITADEDQTYTFLLSDFGYLDANGDLFDHVLITGLESVGALELFGGNVILNQMIDVADVLTGDLKFVPVSDENGASYDSFQFKVYDGADYSAVDYTMTVDVDAVNDEPSFTTIGDQTVAEDSGPHTVVGFATANAEGGADESGQTFTYNVSNNNSSLFAVAPTIDSSGQLTYTLATNANGNAVVTVSVTDSGGTINGGDDTSPDQTFDITVTPVADEVTITANDNAAAEPSNDGQFTVTISQLSPTDTTIAYTVTGDATNGIDYTALSGSITILANNATATIDITTIDENLLEDNETIIVTLDSISAGEPAISIGAGNSDSVTLSDDDAALVTIAATDGSAAEPSDDGQFTVTLSNVSDTNTVISYSVSGDAAAGSDYTALSGSVTILANATSATIDVSVLDESLLEDDETVTVTLTGITAGDADIGLGATLSDTVTIGDDDSALVTIAATDGSAAEPSDDGQFTVTLSNVSDTNTVISYSVSGDATAGSDYTALSGTVTILANATSATIDVSVLDESLLEDDETVIVTLTGITAGDADIGLGATLSDTVTIGDDDAALVTIAATDGSAAEPSDDGQFTVTLSNVSDTNTVISYSVSGDATAGSDYAALSGTVTILANATSATIDVSVLDESLLEDDETVTVTLTGITAGDADIGLGATLSDTVTIGDDDAALVTIAATDGSAAEPSDDGQFTVTLSNVSDTNTVISYSVSGDATAGSDYTALSGTVTILANATSATIDVSVLDESLLEDDETVTVTLTGITSGDADIGLGATLSDTVTIGDDDAALVTIAATDGSAAEPSDDGQFTVTLSNVSDTNTVISYSVSGDATAGSDYTALSGTVTILANATSATIDVSVLDESLLEDDETVTVTLTGITSGDADIGLGAMLSDTVTIGDDDVALVTIAATDGSAAEPSDDGQFTVTLSNVSDTNTVISYSVSGDATAGSDYTALSGTVTILANATSATIDVSVLDESLLEDDETVTVTLTGITSGDADIGLGATLSDTVTIGDDDAALVTIAATDGSAAEPSDDGQFTVTLSNVSDTNTVISYSVSGDAAAGSDYTALSGTVTILANATSATIDVSVLDESLLEDDETVTVTLTGITSGDADIGLGATLSDTVTIGDDDVALVTIAATDGSAAEPSDDGQFTVTLSNVSDTNTVISYSVSGDATAGSDYAALSGTVTILANATSATIDVSVLDESLLEDDETVTVTLTGITSGDADIGLDATLSDTVTIGDDDVALVTIAATDGSAAEPSDDGQFTVTLSNVSDTNTVISYSVSGDAAAGSDYTALSGTVTILANATSATIDVSVLDESLLEDDETVIVTLTGITSGDADIGLGATLSDTVTIGDDDVALVTIAATDGSAAEPSDDGQFTVTLSNVSDTNTVISYSVSGDATAGSDYTALSGNVTILANATSATIDVSVLDESLLEDDETVTVTLTGITSGDADIGLGVTLSDSVTIGDDDNALVSISNTSNGDETGPVDGLFTVTQSATASTDTVLSYTVTGTATSGSDFAPLSGTVAIMAGSTSATIDVATIDDGLIETIENVTVALVGITSGDPQVMIDGANDSDSLTIADNDSALVSIAATTNGDETGPVNGVFTVTQSAAASTDTVLSYTVTGTATSGVDFTPLSGTVTITAGSTATPIVVSTLNDLLVEATESVIVTLTGITGGDAEVAIDGASDSDTLAIVNNDGTLVSIVTTVNGNEAGPVSGVFTVIQSATSAMDTVLNYALTGDAISGNDFVPLSGTVTITAGSTSATMDISTLDDGLIETTENVTVTLTGVTSVDPLVTIDGANDSDTLTIADNDSALVSIAATANGDEAGPVSGVFAVTQSAVASTDTVLSYTATGTAVSGSDFTPHSGTVTILAGSTSATIDVATIDDGLIEATENVTVTLTAITSGDPQVTIDGANDSDTLTIADNDGALVSVSATSNGDETGPVSGVFTVTQSAAASTDTVLTYIVAGTATGGSDFTPLSGTVTIVAGSTTATIDVVTFDDALVEATESVTVMLAGITSGDPQVAIDGANASDTLAITDNDVNNAPVVIDHDFTIDEDTPLSVAASGLLIGAADLDGDPLVAVQVDGPSHGTLSVNLDGSFIYLPDANFHGVDTFTYMAYDGTVNSIPRTVTVTIDALNDAPVADPDEYSTIQNNTLAVSGSGVLVDDADVDGDALKATLITNPANGVLSFNADGSFTYVPNEDFVGTDSFTYLASDGVTDSGVVTVIINISQGQGFTPPEVETPPPPDPLEPVVEPTDFEQTPAEVVESFGPATETQNVSNSEEIGPGNYALSSIESTYDEIAFLDRQQFDWTLQPGKSSDAKTQEAVDPYELLTETSVLWDALDAIGDRIEKEGFKHTLMAGTAFLLATIGSIAYVIWTVWGGYLLGSLTALMPHWQLMDPLPVLDKEHDELEREDGESLESIANKQQEVQPVEGIRSDNA